ncbi:MAG TPA: hypothetical protein VG537_10555 [Candidatus Kapabacteria bacterium]|nr:hypothetical protein [Candidatus Kapabacteria bacterium]
MLLHFFMLTKFSLIAGNFFFQSRKFLLFSQPFFLDPIRSSFGRTFFRMMARDTLLKETYQGYA